MVQRIPAPPPAGPDTAAPAADPLDALQAQAHAIEGTADPAAPAALQPTDPGADAAELLAALKLARSLARAPLKWWQDFPHVWGDDTLQAIAAAGAEVMALHGWTAGQLLGKWGPYLSLCMAVGAPSWVTWEAIKDRREWERRQRARPPAPSPAPAPMQPQDPGP